MEIFGHGGDDRSRRRAAIETDGNLCHPLQVHIGQAEALELVPRPFACVLIAIRAGLTGTDAIRKMVYCFGGRARFFSKNPMLLPQMPLLKDLFPDARFVHVVRDARMAANSLVKLYRLENEKLERLRQKGRLPLAADKPWLIYPRTPKLAENVQKYGPDDIRTTAHLWNDAETFVHQNKDKLPNFYEVRYEDILADPQKEVLGILEFCGLPEPGQDNTEYWQKLGEFGKIRHKNVYGDFDGVESICGENMRRYGYS